MRKNLDPELANIVPTPAEDKLFPDKWLRKTIRRAVATVEREEQRRKRRKRK